MMIAMECKEKEPQMNADERRFVTSAHRKAQQHYLHFNINSHPQNRTRMTRIGRICTDNLIRVIRVPSHFPWKVRIAISGIFFY